MASPVFGITANNIKTTVVGEYVATSRLLRVLNGSGIQPAPPRYCRVTVVRQSDDAMVIYKCTNVQFVGGVYELTVDPIENTNDLNFHNNDRVEMRVTAGALEDIHSAITDLNATLEGNFGPQGQQGVEGVPGPLGPTGQVGPQGVIGNQGRQGQIGVQGYQGTQGWQGFQGVLGTPSNIAGPQGSRGFQGTTGNTGPQGNTGLTGTQGLLGNQGVMGTPGGPQGVIGVQGIQGFQGVPGLPGGPQGEEGYQGEIGFVGPIGPIGPIGLQGAQGYQGFQGVQGFQGTQGRQGFQGFQGVQGVQGVQGLLGFQGFQGRQGFQGNQGYQGTPGLSQVGTPVLGGTAGSVLFVGPSGTLAQNNARLYWDDNQTRLSVGTNVTIGFVTMANTRPDNPVLVLRSAQNVNADHLRVQNYNGTANYFTIDSAGRTGIGQTPDASAKLLVTTDATMSGIRVRNTTSTLNSLEVQNSGFGTLINVGPLGNLFVGSPVQGSANRMGTVHVSHNINNHDGPFFVAQQNIASPGSLANYYECKDSNGVCTGVWDYQGNMWLGYVNLGGPLLHRLVVQAPSQAGASNLCMKAASGTTGELIRCVGFGTPTVDDPLDVFTVTNQGNIEGSQVTGILFGSDRQNSNGGKIAFYNGTPIAKQNAGDVLACLRNLNLIGSSVYLPVVNLGTTRSTVVRVYNNYTVTDSDNVYMILVNNPPAGVFYPDVVQINLPNAANNLGRVVGVKYTRGPASGYARVTPIAGQFVEMGNTDNAPSDTIAFQFECKFYMAVNDAGVYWWYRVGGSNY